VSDVFEVVFLCTGNRFRSPLAAALLTRRVEGLPVNVTSLGTLDVGPMEPLPSAIAAARELGLDLSDHRARAIHGESLSAADLVLGFERMHVASAVVEADAARERTFTLPELVGLLDLDRPPDANAIEHARSAVSSAHARRSEDVAELRDPLGRPPPEQRQLAHRLAELVDDLADGLFGRP
jgi:protein-tyrosine phosphatase